VHEDLIGMTSGWSEIEYNWRDSALYALAVGADEKDLLYTYEKHMKAVPSFGCLPFYTAVGNKPKIPLPYPVHYQAQDYLSNKLGRAVPRGMHMAFQMETFRPIDPIKGTLLYNTNIKKIYDRGDKGIVLEVDNPVHDEAGRLICRNTSWNIIREVGGYGGPEFPKVDVEYPDRDPDRVLDSYISKTANVLYRLTGDTNYSHVDPEVAATRGQNRPFMQGLSTFGFACFLMVKAVIPGEPERMKRMYAQIRSVAFPDTPVQIRAWRLGQGKASFKYMDMNTGKALLDNCEFEWRE
jgi:acyl dehydratase